MPEDNPSIISHVSVGTNDFEAAVSFYDAVFKAIGGQRIMEHPGAMAYGRQFPEFWVQLPLDGGAAGVGNGTHIGLMTHTREQVDAFYAAAIAAGATGDGEPGGREHYGDAYYGCFVRDLDGHKIEAMHWDTDSAATSGA